MMKKNCCCETLITILNKNDIDYVLLIENQCFANPWTHDHFTYEINNPHSKSFTLYFNGELAGYIISHLIIDQLFILNLAVERKYRRMGLAGKLISYVIAFAVKNSVCKIDLEVRKSNVAAQSLYTKKGFYVLGERTNFYSDGESAILMVKNL